MSLAKSLPKPKSAIVSKWISDDDSDTEVVVKPIKKSLVPEYPNRKNWIPETQADFNSGGAYPEIHVLQYPLEMGRKGDSGIEQALALQTDENGKIKYDLVLHKNGKMRNGKIVHSSVEAMQEKDMDIVQPLPSREELKKIAEETKEAIDTLVQGQTTAYKPRELGLERAKPTFVKYVPAESNKASTRIVRVSEVPVDPLEPPRFKHRKIPRSTGSPPPPVLRSPPRKVSAEEQKNWVIPPCISNWKNAKGYTIPLDKRLANDGRGLQDVTINDNFAKLSEALFIADKHAREEVQLRGEMQVKLAQRLKKEKEEKLRELAQKAREEKSRPLLNGTFDFLLLEESEDEESSSDEEEEKLTAEEKQALRQRQELRREKAKERERRLKQQQSKARPEVKRYFNELKRRDISEKIALGQAQPTASRESMYDQRLFNQTSGLSSGFTSSDAYNLYDKPLFNATAVNIYKPSLGGGEENSVAGVDTSEFKSMLANREVHKGFAGTDSDAARSGPVIFEKETDVFGMDAFMKKAKRGRDNEEESSRKR